MNKKRPIHAFLETERPHEHRIEIAKSETAESQQYKSQRDPAKLLAQRLVGKQDKDERGEETDRARSTSSPVFVLGSNST